MNERSTTILLGGKEYRLIYTLRAVKETTKRFGGIEKMSDLLLNNKGDIVQMIDVVVSLIVILANQGIMIHNFENPSDVQKLLTEEEVELYVSLAEVAEYKDAIFEALMKGAKREIESEAVEEKNVQNG